jgi:quercetin dioxygenase-like cupin family protein
VQSTYVRPAGSAFTVGADDFEVGPGDAFVIPPDVGARLPCLEPGLLIDSFAPRRDDFL